MPFPSFSLLFIVVLGVNVLGEFFFRSLDKSNYSDLSFAGSNGKIKDGVMKLIVKAYVDDLLTMSKIDDEAARTKLLDLGSVLLIY